MISSTIKYGLGTLNIQRDDSANHRIDEISTHSMGRSFSPKPPHSPPIDEQKQAEIDDLPVIPSKTQTPTDIPSQPPTFSLTSFLNVKIRLTARKT